MNDCLLCVPSALVMDHLLGEVPRFHPLVGFGRWAMAMERWLYGAEGEAVIQGRMRGLLAVLLLLIPPLLLSVWLTAMGGWVGMVVQGVTLYLAVGGRALREHGLAVVQAMAEQGLPGARQKVGWLVSRETADLDEAGVARAAVESLLENGCDAIFGALFWFMLLGAPGAVLYRLANTLDAMWGYRNDRYRSFGWAAARLDDLLNLVPARLTAFTYVLVGHSRGAWRAWRSCRIRKSPNATLVMAAGAGALGVRLGGEAVYHGQSIPAPLLGAGPTPTWQDIPRAAQLLRRGLLLWAAVALVLGGVALA
ncbi:MAG: adenosylcobinamide-phosphate synthase CbiB [Magnetococcus sp. DMHC-8]